MTRRAKHSLFLLVGALIIGALFSPIFGYAASLTSLSDTLTRLQATALADHTIQFVTPSGVDENDTITITFDTFDLSNLDAGADFDIEDGDSGDCATAGFVDELVANGGSLPEAATATEWGVSIAGQVLTLTSPSNAATYIAAGDCMQIKIGTHADANGAGDDQIANPGFSGVYEIDIAGTGTFGGDSGSIAVSIADNDGVTVSATVPQVLTFDVDTDTDGCATALNKSDTPQDIELGTITTGAVNTATERICIDLDTNAAGGAVVNVSGNTAGLFSTGQTHTFNSGLVSAETLSAGTEGFGLCVDSTTSVITGTINRIAPYDGSPCDTGAVQVGGLDTSNKTLINTDGDPLDGGAEYTVEVYTSAAVSGATPAASDYTVDATFTAVGTF